MTGEWRLGGLSGRSRRGRVLRTGRCLLEVSLQIKEVSGVLFSIFGVWTEGTPAEVEEWTRKQEEMPI